MALNLSDTSVVNLIVDATVDYIKLRVLTNITDAAKAGLVRAGKLQDDPTTRKINILIHPGGEEYPDVLNTNLGAGAGKYVESAYTMGSNSGNGTVFWRRRLKIEYEIFFSNEALRSDARSKAQMVIDRTRHALLLWDIGALRLKDTLGEYPYDLQVLKQWIFEGGGDGDYNWRGWLVVEFLTETDPTIFLEI